MGEWENMQKGNRREGFWVILLPMLPIADSNYLNEESLVWFLVSELSIRNQLNYFSGCDENRSIKSKNTEASSQ